MENKIKIKKKFYGKLNNFLFNLILNPYFKLRLSFKHLIQRI